MSTNNAIWTRRLAATARSSSRPTLQRTSARPHAAAGDDLEVRQGPELGAVRQRATSDADGVEEADPREVDACPEQLPRRGRRRAVSRELLARGDDAGPIARRRRQALRVRQVGVHVLAAGNVVEDEDDLAVGGDAIAVNDDRESPAVELIVRGPLEAREKRRLERSDVGDRRGQARELDP